MSTLTLRTARREDAPAIYAVHRASFTTLCSTHYPSGLLQRWFAGKTAEGYFLAIDAREMFVCEQNAQVAGFGHAIPGEVAAVFVHPDFAGQGIGAYLLDHAIQCARCGHPGPIKVIATLNARRFYEKHGFVEVESYSISRGDLEFPVVEMVLMPPPPAP